MPRILLLSVHFHEGRYHGRPEWPPSPARLFQALVAGAASGKNLPAEDRAALAVLDRPDWWGDETTAEMVREPLLRAAAWYYLRVHGARGTPVDSVARFHLGNGARLERLNFLADTSERALQQSHGLMANYLYDLEHIEQNHEAYAQQHAIVASGAVTRLVRAPTRDVAPAAE